MSLTRAVAVAALAAPAALCALAFSPTGARAAARGVIADVPAGGHLKPSPLARQANLPDGGGMVLHSNRTHLIFWAPRGSGLSFDPGYQQLLETFLARVAHDSHLSTNVYGLTGQYYDDKGPAVYDSTYAGSTVDPSPLPVRDPLCAEPSAPPVDTGPGWSPCVTDEQIQAELTSVTASRHLPTGLRDIYFLVTPNGLGDCVTTSLQLSCALAGTAHSGYCGYHSATGADLLYAVIPYNALPGHCQSDGPRPNASAADPAISSLSHEHNEVITNPLGNAWIDGSANENGDLCLDTGKNPPPVLGGSGSTRYDQLIDGGRYWLQTEWSNQDRGCAARDEADPLSVGIPRNARLGAGITFTGHGLDPDGRISSYLWAFGDGAWGHGARPRHAYRRTGRFSIRLRSIDSAGNWASASRAITIVNPRPRGTPEAATRTRPPAQPRR